MTRFGMPFGMWALFAPSFRKQLTAVPGYDADTAKAITKKAKPQYRQIIRRLPEFEKADCFKMNLVNCAMIGAFILSMPQRPEVDRPTMACGYDEMPVSRHLCRIRLPGAVPLLL